MPIAVRAAAKADRPAIADLLARAFIDDPAMAHIFRFEAQRADRLQRFFALITRIDPDCTPWSLALNSDGAATAVAMWRPPGAWQTPTATMIRHLPAMITTFGTALTRALATQSVLESHHPHAPHWYLQFAGCLPAAQGQGYGGAAIRARLETCDAQGLPAALETATPSNIGLYQALGFAVIDTFVIKNGPQFWSMWREPRG